MDGWVNGKIDDTQQAGFTKFLGRYGDGDDHPSKTFFVPSDAEELVFEFDFYEIDSWESDSQNGPDCIFGVFGGSNKIHLGAFNSTDEREDSGEVEGIRWQRVSLNPPEHLGFGGGSDANRDQKHRVTAYVPPEYYRSGEIELQLLYTLTDGIRDESAGFDNVKITARYDCGCVPSKDIVYEDFEDGLPMGWFNGMVDGDSNSCFTKFLGRFDNSTENPYKVYPVPAGADRVVLELDFYEIDSWDGETNDEGPDCFYAYIGEDRTKLDFGIFSSVVDEGLEVGSEGGISWMRESTQGPYHCGFRGDGDEFKDQKHHISITIPNKYFQNGFLPVELESILTGLKNEESSGIDNVRLTAFYDCGCAEPRPIILDSFENGLATGWTNGKVASSPGTVFTSFLGPYTVEDDGVYPEKVFAVPTDPDFVMIEFDFYEIDHWQNGGDTVFMNVDGERITFGSFRSLQHEGRSSGVTTNGISWERNTPNAESHIAFENNGNNNKDQVHHISVRVPKTFFNDGEIGIMFGVIFDSFQNTEKAGFDNIFLTGHYDCVSSSCTVLDFEEDGVGSPLRHGDKAINSWNAQYGLTIMASGGGDPTIFNSYEVGPNMLDGDHDLGSPNEGCRTPGPGVGTGGAPGKPGENCDPLNNILVLQEPGKTRPDDNSAGGVLSFVFAFNVTVEYIKLLDIDYGNQDHMECTSPGGEHHIINFEGLGKNSVLQVPINLEVSSCDLYLAGSGAVAELGICFDNDVLDILENPGCNVIEHRFGSQCNLGNWGTENVFIRSSNLNKQEVYFQIRNDFDFTIMPIDVWFLNPNTGPYDSPHNCWMRNTVTQGGFLDHHFTARCENGWATLHMIAGSDSANQNYEHQVDVFKPYCQAGVDFPDFDPSGHCYFELRLPCGCDQGRRLTAQELPTLSGGMPEVDDDCVEASKAVDLYRVPVDNCATYDHDDDIQILSQDGEEITFTVAPDCAAEWYATDFIATGGELQCVKSTKCGVPDTHTAMCVDGAAVVDIYAYGNKFRQEDGSQLMVPKACHGGDGGSRVCHFRYVLKCSPSKCETDSSRLKGMDSLDEKIENPTLFQSMKGVLGWAI
uniref:Uncharacterized protein n=1 Tax=Grammatophora oceanica TaxID=210454 RepID=A0A7S1UTB9_9STRA